LSSLTEFIPAALEIALTLDTPPAHEAGPPLTRTRTGKAERFFLDVFAFYSLAFLWIPSVTLLSFSLVSTNRSATLFSLSQGVINWKLAQSRDRPMIHLYEIFLELKDIEHRTTKVGNLRTNGFVERSNLTLLDEFFRTCF